MPTSEPTGQNLTTGSSCFKLSFLLLFLLFSGGYQLLSQNFWQTTTNYPRDPKTAITLASDTCLFVGQNNGIFRSCDGGEHFEQVFSGETIVSLFTNRDGKIFAGDFGKIFSSSSVYGQWVEISLNIPYPILQIIENADGNLFATTGALTENGFEGAGIYYSSDGGLHWSQRNTGLGQFLCIEGIASDESGHLYAAAADEYVTGNGGLFVSSNNGLNWEHINIRIDGKGLFDPQVKVANTTGLAVLNDSLYFSFYGVAINVSVTLNTRKSLNDLKNNNFWNVYSLGFSSSWWLDRPLFPIHFAANGDRYSSTPGTTLSGGSYYAANPGSKWLKMDSGLGVDIFGLRNRQYYSEDSKGRVFMVQFGDPQVYWTNASELGTHVPVIGSDRGFKVFPSPVSAGEIFNLTSEVNQAGIALLYDANGKLISKTKVQPGQNIFQAPEQTGIFYLKVVMDANIYTFPVSVY